MLVTMLGGRYRVVRQLGSGGFSQTYLAADQHLPTAPLRVVKQLQPTFTDPAALASARRLFGQEAEVLHRLGRHPQIPQLYAHFEQDQNFYLVLEYIEGTTLQAELVPGRSLPAAPVVAMLDNILTVLAFVHQQGVIHRDVKPANLIRRQTDGTIALIDFGAVKQVTGLTEEADRAGADLAGAALTVPVGSPGYMPPEQSRGQPRYASDLYAVGMLGIQALTGLLPDRLPEDAATGEVVWRDQAPAVDAGLASVLERLVRRDFRHRYPSATEALHALRAIDSATRLPDDRGDRAVPKANPRPPGARRRWLGLGACALIGVGGWHFNPFIQWLTTRTPLLCQLQRLPSGTFSYSGGTTWVPLRNQVEPTLPQLCPLFRLRYASPLFERPSSGASIRMLLNDQIDFAQSTRHLKDQEYAIAERKGFRLQQVPVALDGIAIAAHPQLDLPGLTMAQVKDLLTGQLTNWQQVGGPNLPIRIYNANPQDSSTMEFLQSNFLAGQPIRRDLQPAGNITQALRRVAADPGGVHFASAAHLVTQCSVKTLPVGRGPDRLIAPYLPPARSAADCAAGRRNEPNFAAFRDGSYPLTRPLFVIVKQNAQAAQQAGEAYSRLLLSEWGQSAIEQSGFVRIR